LPGPWSPGPIEVRQGLSDRRWVGRDGSEKGQRGCRLPGRWKMAAEKGWWQGRLPGVGEEGACAVAAEGGGGGAGTVPEPAVGELGRC
jgi:hypothetical protein